MHWAGLLQRTRPVLTTELANEPTLREPTLGPVAQINKHPIHPMLVPIPIACFVGVLLTDLTYWWSEDMMWADFSACW
jgi:hypothetical protein